MAEINTGWSQRISRAKKHKDAWESRFKCKTLEEYYEGFQWKNVPEGYAPYTFNEVYSTIAIKIASYLFGSPKFNINSAPGHDDFDLEAASKSANLKQDVLNTIIQDARAHFSEEVELAFRDSWFRFGIMEVGYGADWIENPRAPRPYKKSDRDNNVSDNKDRLLEEPRELPANERIFFKRIMPERFVCSFHASPYLERQDWCGYWDYVDRADLKVLKGIKNKQELETGAGHFTDAHLVSNEENEEGQVKVWHIWDLRAHVRYILLDGSFLELWSRPFTRLPLFDIRWIFRSRGFYPVPPVFHWLSPQDEINESREQLRSHRRRFSRKYQVRKDTIDDDELDKFTNGGDGTVIKVNVDEAIKPVADAPMSSAMDKMMMLSKDDFNILTATSSEQRGVADRTTATQANLIAQRSAVREDYEQNRVKRWLCRCAREALVLMREKFTTGMWAELSIDPGNFLGEVQIQQPVYQWVTSEDLTDGYDYRIDLDLTSISPAKQEEEMKKFMAFLSVINQFPQIGLSPTLIREAAIRIGYRNEKVIGEFQKMAMLQMVGLTQQAQQNSMQQGVVARMTPNTQNQIDNQIKNQGVMQ